MAETYIEFFDVTHEYEDRKTAVWEVCATRDGAPLGRIKWFGRWRQYAFFPATDCIFNTDCLDQINWKIRGLMAERRN